MAKAKGLETDILIIGGGIAGLTLAGVLAGAGVQVHLVEPFPPKSLPETRETGRTVALMQSSLNIVKATGVWERISDKAGRLAVMRIIDDSIPGRKVIQSEFPAREIGMEEFGCNISNCLLRAALYESAQQNPKITLHTAKLEHYDSGENTVTARLDNGTNITARLIVGADGRNSAVREQAKIECRTRTYDQSAITCLIEHRKDHQNTATEFHRPGGPLAFVPLPGNRSSVVWVEKTERAEALIRLKKDEFAAALQKSMNNILGEITLEAGPECWPLSSLRAVKLTAPRMALCAEAAHVMSPITAQGLNLSLRDIAALAETIVDAMRAGLDPGSASVLERYARRRRTDVKSRVFGVDAMNRIVSNDFGPLQDLRRLALRTATHLPPLKKLGMRTGLAPQIDEGRLAQGKAL